MNLVHQFGAMLYITLSPCIFIFPHNIIIIIIIIITIKDVDDSNSSVSS